MTIVLDAPTAVVRRGNAKTETLIQRTESPGTLEPIMSDPVAGSEDFRPFPEQFIDAYVDAAIRRALTEQMEDERWFAQVYLLPGVWADGDSEEEVMVRLRSVTREWVLLKIEDRDKDFPVLDSLDLNWVTQVE